MSVEIRNLSVDYGNVHAVDSVSFRVDDGEFTVILGPSGCGKTTVLKCIAGLLDPSAGEIYIDGRMVNGIYPSERNVAMVFQNYALYPHLTVFDNIALNMKMRNMPKDEIKRKVTEVASMLRINELLQKKPRQLSGGQAQRVGLARALVRNPSVFLMDEPLSNLDAKLRLEMRDEIRRFHSIVRKSVLYVTHDQVEAMTLGDRIIVMNKGKIVQQDRPKDLFDRPAHVFVASFLGNPPMNLVQASAADGRIFAGGGDGSIVFKANTVSMPGNVIVGFRPTDLELSSEGQISGSLDYVELLGAEFNVHFSIGNTRCTASLYRTQDNEHLLGMKSGERISFIIDPERIHLFDANSGERIEVRGRVS